MIFENKILVFRNEFYWTFDIDFNDPDIQFGGISIDDSYKQMRELFDDMKTSIMGSFMALKNKVFYLQGYRKWLDWQWTGPTLQSTSEDITVKSYKKIRSCLTIISIMYR